MEYKYSVLYNSFLYYRAKLVFKSGEKKIYFYAHRYPHNFVGAHYMRDVDEVYRMAARYGIFSKDI